MPRAKAKIEIVHAPCQRCGKPLAMTSRSLYGLDQLKAKYGSICSQCMTEDEKQELLSAMGEGILKTVA